MSAACRQLELGDLDRVVRCVKLGGFVNAEAAFTDQPEVINGASDLMVEVFGDAGRHARFAVGAASLPRGVAVDKSRSICASWSNADEIESRKVSAA